MNPSFQLKDNTAFKNRQPSTSLDTGLIRCIVERNEAWRHTEHDQEIVQCELAMIEQLELEKDTMNRNPMVQVPIEIDLGSASCPFITVYASHRLHIGRYVGDVGDA